MMDFRQHDDTIIELRLTDRRGRPIRASVCHDLKIRVWTQDPRQYISFYPRDIKQDHHRDFLVIPDYEMGALSPGVIIYRYSFRQPVFDGEDSHRHEEFEKAETVVTDMMWRGLHSDPLPSNPINAHTLEGFKRNVEEGFDRINRQLTRQKDLFNNLDEDFSRFKRDSKNELSDGKSSLDSEVSRAKREEQRLEEKIDSAVAASKKQLNNVKSNVKNLGKDLNAFEETMKLEDIPEQTFQKMFEET